MMYRGGRPHRLARALNGLAKATPESMVAVRPPTSLNQLFLTLSRRATYLGPNLRSTLLL